MVTGFRPTQDFAILESNVIDPMAWQELRHTDTPTGVITSADMRQEIQPGDMIQRDSEGDNGRTMTQLTDQHVSNTAQFGVTSGTALIARNETRPRASRRGRHGRHGGCWCCGGR
ncbi:hypothetical protein J6590_000107 [Homalodisca vitripennis]|nr:hypothetical protein J6590_000107 [Homalodisca vitripennis]